jgi:hypothetical protein
MRSARLGVLLCTLLFTIPLRAQLTQAPTAPTQDPTATTLPPVTKDAQAVSAVNQALIIAGGIPAITAITDYTATGSITLHMDVDKDVQGSVTVRGSGLGDLRLDLNLPSGISSRAIAGGQVSEKAEDGVVRGSFDQPPMLASRFVIPYLPLAPLLNSAGYSVTYKGVVQIDGATVHDIQIQRIAPGLVDPTNSRALTVDFFIDPTNFQVVMTRDIVFRRLTRELRYSDYRVTNGVLLPFTISEHIEGQSRSLIQLNQIQLSTGLTESDFQL